MGRRRGQARLLAHFVAPAGRGPRGALPGHQVRHRPRHRKRLLLRRRFPDADHRGRPSANRTEDAGALPQQGAARPPRGPQGRSAQDLHREGRPVQGRADLGPRGRHHLLLYQRRVHGPLPRTAHPQYGLHQGTEAHLRSGSLLARQREEQDADAHLRHLVPQEVDARRVPQDDGGGQEARPPQAGQGPRRSSPRTSATRSSTSPRAITPNTARTRSSPSTPRSRARSTCSNR